MKKITSIVCALFFGSLLLAGCDKVEGDYYEIVNQEDVTVEFPDLNPATVYRKILIEEFTGHRCNNCPEGHQILEDLHQQYGDTLVAVGIHYGSLAKPDKEGLFTYDFRTEAGNQIGGAYNIDGIPKAIVNRVEKQGGWPRAQWATVVHDVDRSQVYAALQVINEYNASNKNLKANVKVTILQDYTNPLRVVVYVLEDGIVKPQKDGLLDIEEYVHNHVLRTALTDPFGLTLANNKQNWTSGDSETYASSVSLAGTDWVPENCYVVAFLLDPIKNEVIQVETAKVLGDSATGNGN